MYVEDDGKAYSQPSLSATDIIPRAITGRAREVPSRYTFCDDDQPMITARRGYLLRKCSLPVQQGILTLLQIHASSPASLCRMSDMQGQTTGFK